MGRSPVRQHQKKDFIDKLPQLPETEAAVLQIKRRCQYTQKKSRKEGILLLDKSPNLCYNNKAALRSGSHEKPLEKSFSKKFEKPLDKRFEMWYNK